MYLCRRVQTADLGPQEYSSNLVYKQIENYPLVILSPGVNICHMLQSAVEEWNIQGKVVSMTTDNARNIILAVSKMRWSSFPCFGHTLQIAIRAGLQLPSLSRSSARCRKLVGHFRHSYNEQNALERKQEQLQLKQHKIIQEVSTSWNSTLEMYKRLLEQQTAVSAVLLENWRLWTKKKNMAERATKPDTT